MAGEAIDERQSAPVERIGGVVIRIAGDSGDGMQLTGDRFTAETAAYGNDLSTLPNFPAEIRAPAGTLPGVSAFQLHFADHDILTPGDAPDVLVAMNPAALKANIERPPRGGTIIVNTDEFTSRGLSKVGYAANPLETEGTRRLSRAPGRADLFHREGAGGSPAQPQGSRAGEEHVRARPALLALQPADRPDVDASSTQKFAKRPDIAAREPWPRSRPAGTTARPPRTFAVSYEVAPAPMPAGTLPQHHRQPGAGLRTGRRGTPLRAAAVPRRVPDHPGLGHPARAVASTRTFGVRTFQAEDEIAGIGAALGAAFGGALGVTTSSGPGVALKARDDRARGLARAAAGHLSTSSAAARRPDCRPRPSRPTCCRRCSAATARRRCRSSRRSSPADCFDAAIEAARIAIDVPHAGHPALRRLPGQRLRAVAAARRRRPARPAASSSPPRPTAPDGRGLLPVPARPGDAGASVGRARHARARAPHRRHREGRRHRQHLLRPGQPRPHGPDPRRPRSTASPTRIPPLEVDDPSGERPGAGARLGLDLRPDRGGVPAGARAPAAEVAQAHLRHLNPFPANLGEVLERLRQGAHPGDEPRPAGPADPRASTWSTRSATTRSAACRSRRPSWPRRSRQPSGMTQAGDGELETTSTSA